MPTAALCAQPSVSLRLDSDNTLSDSFDATLKLTPAGALEPRKSGERLTRIMQSTSCSAAPSRTTNRLITSIPNGWHDESMS